jgi:hypothetical protein
VGVVGRFQGGSQLKDDGQAVDLGSSVIGPFVVFESILAHIYLS